jgi:glucose/arabinose dehydrogenase
MALRQSRNRLVGYIIWRVVKDEPAPPPEPVQAEAALTGVPTLEPAVVIEGLDHVWDVAFAPDETMYFTERSGNINVLKDGAKAVLTRPSDVVARGEGGMLGMTLDPDFAANRFLYTCFNTGDDVRVVRWRVSENNAAIGNRQDIITGMPRIASGRHSGCRPRFGPDGYLWVATGDAATGTNPQDPKDLGGKILRVDRDGQAAPDNLGEPFDARVYSYGHRNGQGLAFLPETVGNAVGFSVEHGPGKDDELNPLVKGNFGWDPVPGYNESVPMTDTTKYPDAVAATWSSGDPTIAPSGATILRGDNWRDWNGALAMAVLKGSHVRILTLDESAQVTSETAVLDTFGRIRSTVIGPNNDLYLTTDNGGGADKIIRVTPK